MVLGQIGALVGLYFFVLIFVLFVYILFSNLVGLIPYNFASTAHLVSTLSMSSTIYLVLTGGLIAILLITAISGLELAIAGIQSYVYSILTSSYIKDSVSLH